VPINPPPIYHTAQRQSCQIEIKNCRQSHFKKWLHLYQNINFFTGNQSLEALLSFAVHFTRQRVGFQHFANISK